MEVTVGTVDCRQLKGDACSRLQRDEPVVITRWWGGVLRVTAAGGESWWTLSNPRDTWNQGVLTALDGLALLSAAAWLIRRRERSAAPPAASGLS